MHTRSAADKEQQAATTIHNHVYSVGDFMDDRAAQSARVHIMRIS
jgi:hypothetical protein